MPLTPELLIDLTDILAKARHAERCTTFADCAEEYIARVFSHGCVKSFKVLGNHADLWRDRSEADRRAKDHLQPLVTSLSHLAASSGLPVNGIDSYCSYHNNLAPGCAMVAPGYAELHSLVYPGFAISPGNVFAPPSVVWVGGMVLEASNTVDVSKYAGYASLSIGITDDVKGIITVHGSVKNGDDIAAATWLASIDGPGLYALEGAGNCVSVQRVDTPAKLNPIGLSIMGGTPVKIVGGVRTQRLPYI